MGGPEAVEEVNEGNAALNGGQVSHGAQVHDLLGVSLAQHGKTGLTAGIHVGMIAEDVQSLSGHGTSGDMEYTRQQLTGNLVHIGDHQQQALRSSIGSRQSAGCQRTVHRAGSAGFGLHLHNLHRVAEDVFAAGSGPLVHIVSHGAGGGDGVDTSYFRERVADMSGSSVAVHGFEFSGQSEIPPKSIQIVTHIS